MLKIRSISEAPIGEIVCAFKADGEFFKGKAWKTDEGNIFFVTDTSLEPIARYAGFISMQDLLAAISNWPSVSDGATTETVNSGA
jgi:hypothetical protein